MLEMKTSKKVFAILNKVTSLMYFKNKNTRFILNCFLDPLIYNKVRNYKKVLSSFSLRALSPPAFKNCSFIFLLNLIANKNVAKRSKWFPKDKSWRRQELLLCSKRLHIICLLRKRNSYSMLLRETYSREKNHICKTTD